MADQQCIPSTVIRQMMKEVYLHIDPHFEPDEQDIANFRNTLDRNRDGIIDRRDLADITIRYFSSPSLTKDPFSTQPDQNTYSTKLQLESLIPQSHAPTF